MALAKSQAYQDAADAPATLRAYTSDLANYKAWCERHGFEPIPATPEGVGAYLAAAGEGLAGLMAARTRQGAQQRLGGRHYQRSFDGLGSITHSKRLL
jgi:site-specific recombinase XerD